MRRSAALSVLVALAVLGTLIAPGVVGAQDESAAARNLSLEDLAPGGTKPANAPDSVRANGKYGEFVVKHLPTGLLVDERERSPSWRYMRSGTTIKRNYVQLWSKRAYGASNQEYTVRIAHWKQGQKEVVHEDGSRTTEQVATNVTTYERSVTFAGGYDYARIDLEPHYDGRVRTTMCIQEPEAPNCLRNPGDTRWLFYHASSAASAPITTHSQGGRLAWGLGFLVLPAFGVTVVTLYGGRKFVEAARAGPQISVIWWIIGLVVTLMFTLMAWDWVSTRLIDAPWLASAVVGLFLGVIAVEWFGRDTYGAGFLQFVLADGFDPTDPAAVQEALEGSDADEDRGPEHAPGILKARFMVQRFARGPNGERSAIRTGLRKFWARARGATADLEVDGNMQTRIEVDGPIEELYLLDPDAEEPLEYEPEHHEISFPDLVTYDEDGNASIHPTPYLMGIGALGLSWLAGSLLAGSGTLGLLVGSVALLATRVAKPVKGRMHAALAPMHYHHAVAAMLTHAAKLGDARSWEDWFMAYTQSEADKSASKKDLTDKRSKSQMEELFDRYTDGTGSQDATKRSESSTEAPADD